MLPFLREISRSALFFLQPQPVILAKQEKGLFLTAVQKCAFQTEGGAHSLVVFLYLFIF